MVHVFYSYVSKVQLKYPKIEELENALPERFRNEAKQFVNPVRRASFVLGRFLILESLKTFHYKSKQLNDLQTNEYGRMYLDKKIDFNLSHSDNIVVCASTMNNSIGIDIERTSNKLDLEPFTSCFTPSEQSEINQTSSPSKKLIELWTKKESLAKAIGLGLSIELSNIIIHEKIGFIKDSTKMWHFYPVNIHPDYVCHLCAEKRIRGIVIKEH